VRRPLSAGRLSLLVVFAVTCASPAWGYVRKKTDGGVDEYWQVSCIPLTVYTNGYGGMTRDEVAKSVAAAARTWGPSAVTCPGGSHPFLEIVASLAPDSAEPPSPGYDGRNTLFFYTPSRPYPDDSGISFGIIALTSTWARADGHIVDADVRVNAFDNIFANADPGFVPGNGQDTVYDLQNALTHELGHLIGLGHTCWNLFSDPEQPIDDQNVGVPTCDAAPPDVQETVMFATIPLIQTIEVKKRVLSPDDVLAVCSIYPAAQDPQVCGYDTLNDGCGCSAAAGFAPAGASLAVLAAAGLALRRRRRAAVSSAPARPADCG
jgi:MYXO-CTERM domain-containing protein